jgi:hypothetical protein
MNGSALSTSEGVELALEVNVRTLGVRRGQALRRCRAATGANGWVLEGVFGLYGQVNKCIRWMPWRSAAMKDVTVCEKLRGGDNIL